MKMVLNRRNGINQFVMEAVKHVTTNCALLWFLFIFTTRQQSCVKVIFSVGFLLYRALARTPPPDFNVQGPIYSEMCIEMPSCCHNCHQKILEISFKETYPTFKIH